MIKSLIDKFFGGAGKAKSPFGKREDVPQSVHGIDRNLVDDRALDVVKTLHKAGYEAYIVGGAVRDLLLGLRPKDFDVATNATPEQVKGLFRRAFIIGRRFRIVHVVYGRGRQDRGLSEVIEVSTFRAYLNNADAEQVKGNERTQKHALERMSHAVDESGRVLRDNVWGPMEHDAARRDFTINAMYYDPESQTVVDFHHGIRDAQKRVLRMIGDPATRYREDPVRVVRAVRFAAKLQGVGFKFEAKTRQPLVASAALLADVPQSRLFDEMLKLLQTGHALASINQLKANGLAQGIYPMLDLVVQRADHPMVNSVLQDTDRRVGEGKPVAPSFLLACVLWPDVSEQWQRHQAEGWAPFPALQAAVDEVFDARVGDVSGRGKLGTDMKDVWFMQPRFDKRTGNGPFTLVEQPRFRAGFDFMRLRAGIGEVEEELSHWWESFSLADEQVRRDMVDEVRLAQQRARGQGGKAGKVVKPRAKPAAAPAEGQATTDGARSARAVTEGGAAAEAGADEAVKKRRRRRRKPNDATPRDTGGAE